METEKRDIRRVIYLRKSEAALIDKAALTEDTKTAVWIRSSAVRAAKAMGLNGKGVKR